MLLILTIITTFTNRTPIHTHYTIHAPSPAKNPLTTQALPEWQSGKVRKHPNKPNQATMKTTLSAAAPEDGANHGVGSAPAKTPSVQDILNQPTSALPTGHYGDGSRFGGIRYPVGDPVVPVNDGAKVKMELAAKNNNQLIPYIQNHIEMMTGNPFYTAPQPPTADFLAQFNLYQAATLAAINAEAAWKDAISLRDQMRYDMTTMMNARGAYIQEASNGNKQAILSCGLGVKNPPTYVTTLSAPTNLRVDLNGEAGMMKIRWDGVTNALTYVLQCSRDVTPRVWEQLSSTTKTQVTKTLEVGVTYAFRVAANGTPGQSNWSPEVIRGAA